MKKKKAREKQPAAKALAYGDADRYRAPADKGPTRGKPYDANKALAKMRRALEKQRGGDA